MSKPEMRNLNRSDAESQSSAQALLYLAGELVEGERASFERRLAEDPTLRRDLDELRAAKETIASGLSAVDAAEPIDVRLRGIDRNMSRLLRQWQVDRLTARPASVGDQRRARFRRVPVWLYPLAAAAAVALMLGVWSLVIRDPVATPIVGLDNTEQADDNDSATPERPAGRDGAVANSDAISDEVVSDEFSNHLATIHWNPLGDVGADSLASIEREYDAMRLLEYSQYGAGDGLR